ncbi:MAG TPA: PEGA domain-containing protein [Polyangia bacterium]
MDAVAVVSGTYSLQVSAPGYETVTIQVEVNTPPPGHCGCSLDSIEPSTVLIGRTDGGVD